MSEALPSGAGPLESAMDLQPELETRLPSIDEYLTMTRSVGWSDYVDAEAAEIALANSLHCVVVSLEGAPIGMGRIVGDAAMFFYLQDVVVTPESQGLGVGRLIMDNLMSWIENNASDKAFVGLFAAHGKGPFYERYGFSVRAGERPGMELLRS